LNATDNKKSKEPRDSIDASIRKFMKEQKEVKDQVILAYDKQLFALYEELDEIEKNMKREKKLDLRLMKMQIKLTDKVCRLLIKKFEIEMQPTLDPKLNKIIIKAYREDGHLDEDHIINFLMGNHSN
jgi:CRISPR/Cas system CSM-associated protein Csm2 small subunit